MCFSYTPKFKPRHQALTICIQYQMFFLYKIYTAHLFIQHTYIQHTYLPVKSTATLSNNANHFTIGNIKIDP